jgi:predicted nucleic acid-binding protein
MRDGPAANRKRLVDRAEAAAGAADDMSLFGIVEPVSMDARPALTAAAAGIHACWDALLLATLGRARCSIVLSQDMQDGVTLEGVTLRHPFQGERLPAELDRSFT